MPFRTFHRLSDGRVAVDHEEPDPELRETDDPKVGTFVLLRSFSYRVPDDDPESGTVYVVPGADAPAPGETTTDDDPPQRAVIAPTNGGRTDLASVPPFLWWLIASYGNHTRAALLHDALYVEDRKHEPVSRATADRLFLTALREPGQKKGAFRHWLMWVGVSLFGTMRRSLGALFVIQTLVIWGFVIAGCAWAWVPGISWPWWGTVLVTIAGAIVFLIMLGTSWRAGVDLRAGWLVPDLLLAVVILVPLGFAWAWPPSWSPFTLFLVAAVLFVLGLFWGRAVDPTLTRWLWPTGLIGLPVAMLPIVLIGLSLGLVWLIDVGAAFARGRRKDESGNRRGFEMPELQSYRLRV